MQYLYDETKSRYAQCCHELPQGNEIRYCIGTTRTCNFCIDLKNYEIKKEIQLTNIYDVEKMRGGSYVGRFNDKLIIDIEKNGQVYTEKILGEMYIQTSFEKKYRCENHNKHYICEHGNQWGSPSIFFFDASQTCGVEVIFGKISNQAGTSKGPKLFERYQICGALFVENLPNATDRVPEKVIRIRTYQPHKESINQCYVRCRMKDENSMIQAGIKRFSIRNDNVTLYEWKQTKAANVVANTNLNEQILSNDISTNENISTTPTLSTISNYDFEINGTAANSYVEGGSLYNPLSGVMDFYDPLLPSQYWNFSDDMNNSFENTHSNQNEPIPFAFQNDDDYLFGPPSKRMRTQ